MQWCMVREKAIPTLRGESPCGQGQLGGGSLDHVPLTCHVCVMNMTWWLKVGE
jgi:hypothetical protein